VEALRVTLELPLLLFGPTFEKGNLFIDSEYIIQALAEIVL
jgi:hypothetical protein